MARSLVSLPKAHVHLHLEGSARPGTMNELAQRQGLRLEDLTHFSDLPCFIRCYQSVVALITEPADLTRLCRELVADEAAQGVTYLEPFVRPEVYADRFGCSPTEVLDLIRQACREAGSEHHVEVGFMLGINRAAGIAAAEAAARFAAEQAGNGVVALGIAGDEALVGPDVFAPACELARMAGLLIVPHAGETVGPESVRAALDTLHPHRIAHGIRAAEDAGLLARLSAERIPCDVCLTSNVRLQVVSEVAQHPLPHFMAAGVPVTINADDSLFFDSGITDEYVLARETFGLSDSDLATIALTSIEASGASTATVARTRQGIAAWLACQPD